MPTFSKNFSSPIKVVDISAQPQVAQVFRNGRQVKALEINQNAADALIRPDLLDARPTQQRVLTQSIPAGQRVPRGTSVDVVLVARDVVQMGVFRGVHEDLTQLTVSSVVQTLLQSETLQRAIDAAESYDELDDTAKTELEDTAREAGIRVDEAPGRSGKDLFAGVQIARGYTS